MGFFSVE
jgi:hypothetical protein